MLPPSTNIQQGNTLGYGIGLRKAHYQTILNMQPSIDWFEIISEDYLVPGGRPLHYLSRIRERYPIVMHGVSLSIGSTDPLDDDYLKQLKRLAEQLNPAWISDHCCWTAVNGTQLHDLLPLPYTEEALNHVVARVSAVQEFLGRQILLENVSSYITYRCSELTEWEFLAEVAKRADCLLLLDVNNVYVSAFNHRFDPMDYINGIPLNRVQQFHLAGHRDCGQHLIDTHDEEISEPVWQLYQQAVTRFGALATLIERDDKIPELSALMLELNKAKRLAEEVLVCS